MSIVDCNLHYPKAGAIIADASYTPDGLNSCIIATYR